jgi:hypothetical protein
MKSLEYSGLSGLALLLASLLRLRWFSPKHLAIGIQNPPITPSAS